MFNAWNITGKEQIAVNYYRLKESIRDKLIDKRSAVYVITYSAHRLMLHMVYGEYGIYRIRFMLDRFKRKRGHKSQFDEIKKFQSQYKGKKCFVVATGPSLTLSDLYKLKDHKEYTFGMNSLVRFFDKTEWRPNFYVLQDCDVYRKNKEQIKKYDNVSIVYFIADIVKRYSPDCKELKNVVYFAQDLHNHNCRTEKDYETPIRPKISADCFLQIEDGFTVTYTVLQLAMYMGFKEIYLLGVDCDYSNSSFRFKGHICSPEKQMTISYEVVAEYAKKNGIKIYNATRGGKLEVFERVDFDSLFNIEEYK
ncbi:hypothetical protein CRH03_22195 [Clostridium sp. HMb25]|nr:hypothetical protein CRH03_22195 [Clostridium sp. HMb25]